MENDTILIDLLKHIRETYPVDISSYSKEFRLVDVEFYCVDYGWIHLVLELTEEGLESSFYFVPFDDYDHFGLDYEPELMLNYQYMESLSTKEIFDSILSQIHNYDEPLI